MSDSIIDQLADFTVRSEFANLPPEVISECKRLLLDSIGCALASVGDRGAQIGVDYGRLIGGTVGEATILGTGEKASVFGAAFANAELINALDQDAVLPPGHVTPYVLPAALAVSESRGGSGRDFISAMAVAHEMTYRLGKATDYHRDMKDGVITPPPVSGFSGSVFGATAAIAVVKGLPREVVANALGIAGITSPVNSHRAWYMHAPATTIKYQLAGGLAQSALTAEHMAEFGHRGDHQLLDDRQYGYPRFIGTTRWEPDRITSGLGETWGFPTETSYKPYPHCRVLHALLDVMIEILDTNDITPDEIENITALGETWVEQPLWTNRVIEDVRDAQFSIAHGISMGAHRLPPGKIWQDPKMVFSDSVMGLMDKVVYKPHPDYVEALRSNPAARLSRIEITARGKTFTGDREYPKGSPSPDPSTYMTTDELVAKFANNARDLLSEADISTVVETILNLESVDNISALMDITRAEARVSA